MPQIPPKVLARLAALFARTESTFLEEARTSALLAVQLMRRHGMLPQELADKLVAMATKPRRKAMSQRDFARRGGRAGGRARANAMSAEQRSDAARKAAHARWRKSQPTQYASVAQLPCVAVRHEKPTKRGT